MTKYMVIENNHPGCLEKIYDRFHSKGRMMPEGLFYIDSWLTKDGSKCFQLMETNDYNLFSQWTQNWNDLVDFEIIEIREKPAKPE